MTNLKRKFLGFLIVFWITALAARAAVVRGTVKDKANGEPLVGATVLLQGTQTGATTDMDGRFELAGVRNGSITLVVSYISYKTQTLNLTVKNVADIVVEMAEDERMLEAVNITAKARSNTENALLGQQKNSLVQQTGVSAQQIGRTQDKDASEVIRRVPGISIIEEKFVMVRGLSQRYNNVWVNRSAVPSSEADARAFSFDIIPSSQLDNMLVVKSPAPEYPADFSGGFIMVNTKDIPSENTFNISVGGTLNDRTHFRRFLSEKGSGTDFLGFDNGLRSLDGGINSTLKSIAGDGIDLQNNGLNNDWTVHRHTPVADLSLGTDFSRRWLMDDGRTFALLGALNYGNTYKTYRNMENSLFGAYDVTHDRPNYLRQSTDNQYNHNVRLGAMLNLTFVPASGNSRYELKNIFNQLGKERYTQRRGISAQSDNEESAEYYYSSRTTYNGQLTGKHTLRDESKLDWSAGYAYANRNMPDRRRYLVNDAMEAGTLGLSNANDINREFAKLDEHIFSGNANYERGFRIGRLAPTLKAGVYGEYRTRKYHTRTFIYNWNASSNNLPSGFRYMDIANELLQDKYYGADGLYLLEKVKWSNNYEGNNRLGAGYVAANLPMGKWNVYAGVRFEHNKMELVSHSKDYERSPKSTFYTYNDFFPSINSAYRLDDRQQFRLSYGRTTNRPEFREVSPSIFYDFDLASNVQGNFGLKAAYVDNIDLGYEFYPAAGELISVTLFYKHFSNPIEWTYTVNGGTDLTYSYVNAEGANNFGVEVDVRKSLDFIGLRHFSWNFNGALIKSRVTFPAGSVNENRPMQGQSPYLINTGIFYQNPQTGWGVAALYNRIGKRIIGVGRSLGTAGDEAKIPDSYEMPRNTIDLSLTKKIGKHWEVKAAVRDLLAEKVSFKQFEQTAARGEVEQITRQYRPGRNMSLTVKYGL